MPAPPALLVLAHRDRRTMEALLALLQAWLAVIERGVARGNALLCSPWVTALQFHGIVPCLLLGTLWLLAGRARLAELRRQQRRARDRRLAAQGGAGGKGGGKLGAQEVRMGGCGVAHGAAAAATAPDPQRTVAHSSSSCTGGRLAPAADSAAPGHGGAAGAGVPPRHHGQLAVGAGARVR